MNSMNTMMSSTPVDVLASYNLGHDTFTFKLPIGQFIHMSEIPSEGAVAPDEVSQRNLDKGHATQLAVYILKGLVAAARRYRVAEGKELAAFDAVLGRLGTQPYFSLQPVVVNIPVPLEALEYDKQKNIAGDELTVRLRFPPSLVMWVIDGQHRRWAMNLVLEFLGSVLTYRAYPKKGSLYPIDRGEEVTAGALEVWRAAQNLAMHFCTVSIEAHVGLSVEAQRQLFHDLNNLGKSVSPSLAFDFDNSNPVNMFIKEVLDEGGILKAPLSERDATDWAQHDGSMARKDLVAINSILFLNKTNPKSAKPMQVERMTGVATRFWEAVSHIDRFGEAGAKLVTVAAQSVVLKALAKLVYDFAVGRSENSDHLEVLLNGIGTIDFSHGNAMWRYYELSNEDRDQLLPGLVDYLPDDDGNRDIGGTDDESRMRFGAKHNDIYPILGDMIRWSLKLPNRHEEARRMAGILEALNVDFDL
jgi:hypothetical protein